MLFGGRGVSKGTGGPSASSSSTSRAGSQHQTVHVSVAAAAAAPEAAPEVAVALQRTDAHTLPLMYAFAASGLLWVASEAAVDEGAVAAVAGAAAVSVLFIAKMADRRERKPVRPHDGRLALGGRRRSSRATAAPEVCLRSVSNPHSGLRSNRPSPPSSGCFHTGSGRQPTPMAPRKPTIQGRAAPPRGPEDRRSRPIRQRLILRSAVERAFCGYACCVRQQTGTEGVVKCSRTSPPT